MPVEPHDQALQLLRSVLTPEQRASLDTAGEFDVRGSVGGLYRIRTGRHGNVAQLDDEGEITYRYCIHPIEAVPDPDTMLVQYLLLITDEPAFLNTANRSRPPGALFADRPFVPAHLPTDGQSPIAPTVPDASGMAQLRLLKRLGATEQGRESLAQALLARIAWGGGDDDVVREVTMLSRMVVARAGDNRTEGVRALIDWLETAA